MENEKDLNVCCWVVEYENVVFFILTELLGLKENFKIFNFILLFNFFKIKKEIEGKKLRSDRCEVEDI